MTADAGHDGQARPAPRARHLRVSVLSDEREIRRAVERITRHAAALSDDTAALGAVQIVLAEVLNNVAEHAYARQSVDGTIRITCTVTPGAFRFTVLDEGREMPTAALEKGPRPAPRDAHEDLPEGGFGWPLIRSLSTNLSYARRRGRNCLRFEIPKADREPCNGCDG